MMLIYITFTRGCVANSSLYIISRTGSCTSLKFYCDVIIPLQENVLQTLLSISYPGQDLALHFLLLLWLPPVQCVHAYSTFIKFIVYILVALAVVTYKYMLPLDLKRLFNFLSTKNLLNFRLSRFLLQTI
jgi:hypothetical protein